MSAVPEPREQSAQPQSSGELEGAGGAAAVGASSRARPGAAQLSAEGRLLRRLLRMFGDPAVELVLWNGERVTTSAQPTVARVRIADRRVLFGLLRDPHLRFGDAYSDGRIEIEGDLVRLFECIYRGMSGAKTKRSVLGAISGLLSRPRGNTLRGSRDNIHHHYDIGNEFYALWLGRTMAYTCAYYPTANASLDEAQVAKMDHVCRKLRLRSGERVVEAGFGWGTLALHMAKHYGVKVRAFNISHEQVSYARERLKSEGLSQQVEYVEEDYRNISGHYDAFVSVGMLEHVGVEHYPELGRIARRSLGSNGRGLIHSIGRNSPARLHPWIVKRIFPGAHPPALSEMSQIFEPWDLSILDIENLRLHYAQTLRHWLALFEANAARVRSLYDERFVRMWRFYLAGSVAGFTTGTLQLFQVLFAPQDNNDIPLTRAYMYPG
ncbi:MAG TPA: cyclopropane-fatty-acyl-phospholipid synthase family protein [Steroidobacteraceae bacterium]|nr:cyclopropane-fatty-acyl-phospholipid synthase family protein [Steroidobacteraceae bacterium]